MLLLKIFLASALIVAPGVLSVSVNFPYESVQLNTADIRRNPALRYGNPVETPDPDADLPHCRAWPGSHDWPAADEWTKLNTSLNGALLRPDPPAAACYPSDARYNATTCRWLLGQARQTGFWIDDPLVVLTQWPQGSTCPAVMDAKGNCTRGGFPEYVVNATTAKHIQAAVNFARNKNVRLVIKNTGHDFGGRSMGGGSISVWVHPLKNIEFIPKYTTDSYEGMAVRVGAGVESWEMANFMAEHNITVLTPATTVGMAGGWIAAGGHGGLTSKLGLGSDQVLSINVVTADGKFITADPDTNDDLWWALRGGGPSAFGIVTSVVMRAFPPIRSTSMSVGFSVNPNLPNTARPTSNATSTAGPRLGSSTLTNVTAFWTGVKQTYRHCLQANALGGFCFSYIYPLGNSSFTFTHSFSVPSITPTELTSLIQPLFDSLNTLGIDIPLPRMPPNMTTIPRPPPGAFQGFRGGGDAPINTRYRSRLFPRANYASDALYDRTWTAIRHSIEEGGYTFHGIGYTPTREVAGPLGADSAVNPAWRVAALHASLMETQPAGGMTAAEARERDARAAKYLDLWREVTPGSGAYLNEGDPMEPNWQASFYGDNYDRLVEIKRRRDPWGVFWAQTTPGSEGWDVKVLDGYPGSQNGRLCRAWV
ncbi:6-hydroxy-D-nicotine oxidase [Echria macrotheca]|uniref:6-hydroxy-D-nicotine oxidase n=1 Tax=Echria macrotheca TaxID=438768 RepID=A0AAJ0FCY0_9PEZI|nr:6-hydroxy-D-nicotine oxidase [Echria macrotheca]